MDKKLFHQRLLPALFVLLVSIMCMTCSASAENIETGKWEKAGTTYRYELENHVYLKNGFYQIRSEWYYFNEAGKLASGWFTVGQSKYYAVKSGSEGKKGRLYHGWHTINKKIYFFSEKDEAGKFGAMKRGWLSLKKKIYYFNKSGVLQTGFVKIKNNRFYFLKKGDYGKIGSMVTGWYTINKKKYYFCESGSLGKKGACYQNGWYKIEDKNCYFFENGSYYTDSFSSESNFIKTIGKLAQKDMKKTGILASVTTAQAILESGYGTSLLATHAHNLFGMKASLSSNTWKSKWDGTTYAKKTWEHINGKDITITADFRSYTTYAESIADHSAYLLGARNGSALRYKGVKGNKSYKKTIQIIKNGGYATDPLYVSKICSIIKKYHLTKYDK